MSARHYRLGFFLRRCLWVLSMPCGVRPGATSDSPRERGPFHSSFGPTSGTLSFAASRVAAHRSLITCFLLTIGTTPGGFLNDVGRPSTCFLFPLFLCFSISSSAAPRFPIFSLLVISISLLSGRPGLLAAPTCSLSVCYLGGLSCSLLRHAACLSRRRGARGPWLGNDGKWW